MARFLCRTRIRVEITLRQCKARPTSPHRDESIGLEKKIDKDNKAVFSL